ncbi:hypothetical protein DL546_000039 [Coniochaeta pulveracea]|uniref:Uncharacterized protein n=1 Tax=Coniochaeta pulveracea TaxID=177199 RepID=A0A420XVY1_9PEZI|nr:hypothetical protein DL546_000039 [Coniochaeta pulveracea]
MATTKVGMFLLMLPAQFYVFAAADLLYSIATEKSAWVYQIMAGICMISPALTAIYAPLPAFIAPLVVFNPQHPGPSQINRPPNAPDRCTVCDQGRGACRRHIRLGITTWQSRAWQPERSLLSSEIGLSTYSRVRALRHISRILPAWLLLNQWELPRGGL